MSWEKVDGGNYGIYQKKDSWFEKFKSLVGAGLLLALIYAFLTR